MKKIFSFLAAMLVVFAANAKVWNVGPGHNEESDRTDCNLYVTLDRLAQAGDTILLADGEYIETLSMYVKGAAVIMAAEGANPVLKQSSYFKLKADAKFIGIKFEHVAESNGYCMYFQPGCSRLELQDCEITGFKETCIMSWDEYACNNLIINNCYIHDNVKCVIYDPSGYIANTVITNSTIVNNDCSPWSAAPIDIRKGSSTDHTLLVDHCTFYNNKVSSDSYADIRPRGLNGVKVKNCIFAHPEAYAARATRFVNDDTVEGCEVINCLTFNYTKNTDRFGHYTGSTLTGCAAGNPLFVNAAESNFNLGEGSPALTMNDGAPIGDPRWVPSVAPVEPQMKTIYCKMDKDWWKADGAAVGVYTWDDGGNAKAAWPGERMTPVEGETDIWSIELDINTYHMCIFTRVNGEGDVADWGAKTGDLTIPTDENDMFTITNDDPSWGDPGCIGAWSKYGEVVPVVKFKIAGSMSEEWAPSIESFEDSYTFENLAAGNHKFKVVDGSDWLGFSALTEADRADELYTDQDGNVCFTLAQAGDVVVTYIKDQVFKVEGNFVLPTVQLIGIGGWDADENAITLTAAQDKKSASVTLNLDGWYYEFKMIVGGAWLGKENAEGLYGLHREWTSVDGLTYAGGNIKLTMDAQDIVPGDYIFTWEYVAGKLTVTFPTPAPTGITWELNGGAALPKGCDTNEELWEAFKPDYNAFYSVTRADQPINKVSTFVQDNPGSKSMMMSETSGWKWLGDYLIASCADQGDESWDLSAGTDQQWRMTLHSFFNKEDKTNWPMGSSHALFSEAGKEEHWLAAYAEMVLPESVSAEYTLPAVYKAEATFGGWFDNAEFSGEALTVIPANYAGTLYAKWNSPATNIENTAAAAKVVKLIENGKLIIIRNGVRYNAQGQME